MTFILKRTTLCEVFQSDIGQNIEKEERLDYFEIRDKKEELVLPLILQDF